PYPSGFQEHSPMTMRPPALRTAVPRIRNLTLAIQLEEGRPPPMMRIAVWLAAAVIVTAIVWASRTVVQQVARAPGQIIPSGHVQPVQHLEGGIVRDVQVREGEIVEQGQVLVVLDPTAVLAERDQLQAREQDRKSTRLNSSHVKISYAVFCLKKKRGRDTPAST